MRIAGAIIAGGEASRLGGEKPFVPFAGGTLLDSVIAVLQPQTDVLGLNLRADAAEWAHARYDFPILLDARGADGGPLAGLIAALDWARAQTDIDWLATAPADTPFLPPDLIAQLAAAAKPGASLYARDDERDHYLCALWPPDAVETLRLGVAGGAMRSVRDAHKALGGFACPIKAEPYAFFNVNTPADLEKAEWLAANAIAPPTGSQPA